MPTSQSKQALRARRKAEGLCIHCGAIADRGTRCSSCAEKDAVNRKRYLARDKAAGICITLGCHEKSRSGRVYCAKCAAKTVQRDQANRKAGRCLKCNTTALNGGGYCAEHLKKRAAYMRRYQQKRIAEGKCCRCGDFNLDGCPGLCSSCYEKNRKYRAALKLEVMTAYGGPVCVGCGEDEIMILQIDHVAGGGSKHAEEIGGRGKMYMWLKTNGFPPGYRVLCPSCNMRAARSLPFPNSPEYAAKKKVLVA